MLLYPNSLGCSNMVVKQLPGTLGREQPTQTEAGTQCRNHLGSSGVSVETGFLFTLSSPPRCELLTPTLVGFGRSKPECRDLDCSRHAGDCLGGELPYCVPLRTVTLSGYFVIQRYFLKVRLIKTPWILHDFKCRSNTLNLFCRFPSNMFSIFSPLIWKWCD